MRRELVVLILVLTLATSIYGSDLVGDFEGSLDGWEPQDGTITSDMLSNSTTGATLHDYGLRLDSPGSFRWAIRCPLDTDPNIVRANNHVSFDVTFIASEWDLSTWGAKIDKIAFNGEGISWSEATVVTVEPPLQVGDPQNWVPSLGDQSAKFTWDYSTIDFSSLAENPPWFYFTISVNSGTGGPFYFDNVVFFNSAFANSPEPPNTQTDVSIDTDLSWKAGDDATEHDIYFGTSFDAVNEATNADPMGPTEVYRAKQAVGNEAYSIPETLELGTTYYWRIDEDGVKGEVWSFTTQGIAKDPSPANGAIGVERESLVLSWRPGFQGASHDVFFGTSFANVDDAKNTDPMGPTEVYRAHQTADANSYTIPETLRIGQTYYWRIDENGVKGEVWSFTTFNAIAVGPSPADDANDVQRKPTLSWKPGLYADTHNVYFGNDSNQVSDANTANVASYPNVTLANVNVNSFEPGLLEPDTTYYWRVDEVNDAHPDRLWKGSVWSFTTSEYLAVDDMESYGDAATPGPPPPLGSRIWYTWKDGEGWLNPTPVAGNGTGSVVDPNSGIVHGGTQSLKFYYDNDGTNVLGTSGKKYYSEVTANTAHLVVGAPDWTEDGVKALTLWFYGDPANDADTTEQMYVKLNGEKIDYDGDMNDIRQASWREWNIDLAQFGIDLSSVVEMAIGFGNETNTTTPAGSGTVHFDDIRLHWPRCRPELLAVAGDFDGDCLVDHSDLAMLASDWLAAEETIEFAANEMKKPAAAVLWYKFDETAGTDVTDHAGFYDGTVVNLGDDTWDTNGWP